MRTNRGRNSPIRRYLPRQRTNLGHEPIGFSTAELKAVGPTPLNSSAVIITLGLTMNLPQMTAPYCLDLKQHGWIRLGEADSTATDCDVALAIEKHGGTVWSHWRYVFHTTIISSDNLPVKRGLIAYVCPRRKATRAASSSTACGKIVDGSSQVCGSDIQD